MKVSRATPRELIGSRSIASDQKPSFELKVRAKFKERILEKLGFQFKNGLYLRSSA